MPDDVLADREGRAMRRAGGTILALVWALGAFCAVSVPDAQEEGAVEWWERGQDTWYYKDDWEGLYLTGSRTYKTTVEIPGNVQAAYAYVWSGRSYTFKVNGEEIGSDADSGTIEDYDLTEHLFVGANRLECEAGEEFICEGAALLESGEAVHFASDASWGRPGTRTSKVRKSGPRGYGGDTHMARIVEVTAEQKAKAAVNRLNSVRRRMLDRDRYLFWKHRDPHEVLTLDKPTKERQTWARIERLLEDARGPTAEAARLIREGKLAEAHRAVAPAVKKTRKAEELHQGLVAGLARGEAKREQALANGESVPEGVHRKFNGSQWNRLGWVVSNEPLDNDAAWWEFDIAPPGATSLGLAGLWRFRLDPTDRGLREEAASPDYDDSGWDVIFAPTKWGWERWGYMREHPGVGGLNKPYNGLAWYRKKLVIPAAWQGRDLVLRLGPRWNNVDWLAVNGEWLNDPAESGSNSGWFTIPAHLIKYGQENTVALRIMNESNIGGLINPGLRLSVAEAEHRRSVCGAGTVRETVFETPDGSVRQMVYSSALSPAVVVAASGRRLQLRGWVARGYAAPDHFAFAKAGEVRVHSLAEPIALGRRMNENWLLMWSDSRTANAPRPLLAVLERRPDVVDAVDDGFGGPAIELRFRRPGARVLLVRPFDEPLGAKLTEEEIERCRLWSRALLRYPVGYAERLWFDDDICKVRMAYEYLELKDDWKTTPLTLAPLPMLFSYAVEHNWPEARIEGEVTDLGCRSDSGYYPGSDCGTYRAAVGSSEVAYSFGRMEPKVRYRGIGTLGEERRIGEPMFVRMKEWGCNCSRPQIPFHNLGFFENPDGRFNDRSRVRFDPKKVAWFDEMLATHRRLGLMCFLNWFGLEGRRFSAANRQQVIDFWREMARHCKDLPADLVCYDLMNEPAGIYGGTAATENVWSDYNQLVKDVTGAIREVDAIHPISVESGGGWAQPEDLDMTVPTGDRNTIYQFHYYGPHTGDCHRWDLWYPRYKLDEERFRSYEGWEERMLSPIRFAIRNHAQVMHGEFGISFLGPGESPRRWLEDVLAIHEKYRMHWNWWNYSGGDIHRTGLVSGSRVNPLVPTLSEYARMGPPE